MGYHKFNLSSSNLDDSSGDIDITEQFEVDNTKYMGLETNLGHSAEEWSQILGFGKKKTQKVLKDWLYRGKCRVNKVPIIDVTGRINYTFHYILEDDDGSTE